MGDNLAGAWVNEERFWAKVDRSQTCWLWTGKALLGSEVKYGSVVLHVQSSRGRAYRWEAAHRISYELANGPIPQGLHVLHSCDNGLCVNPAHLHLGTNADNTAEKVGRNRQARGGRTPGRWVPPQDLPTRRGVRHWHAKLTDEQVQMMRIAYAAGGTTVHALARKYSMSVPGTRTIIVGDARPYAGGPISQIRPIIGELVTGSKLNAAAVRDIRKRWTPGGRRGGVTQRVLAVEYGVPFQTISDIVRGRTWKHVV